jgi:hypothetical protein
MTQYALFLLLALVFVLALGPGRSFALEKAPNGVGSRFLVLDDCDDDNSLRTAPYGDTVYMMDSQGEIIKVVARGLMITKDCDGLSVSEDGRFFAVYDYSSHTLTMYEMASGAKRWSLMGFFNTAVFANGLIYAMSGENVFAIDNTGTIVKHVRFGGLDIAVDSVHDALWLVGLNVKKFNLDLELQFKMELTNRAMNTGAFSMDVNPDGSVWIAERNPHDKRDSKNQLVKRSPEGAVLQIIDLAFCPRCVRVDKSDGSVWATGKIEGDRDFSKIGDDWPDTLVELDELTKTADKTFTQKFDAKGKLLLSIPKCGESLIVDPYDGSVWITAGKKIWHFSSTGEKLGVYTGDTNSPKWLALIPGG